MRVAMSRRHSRRESASHRRVARIRDARDDDGARVDVARDARGVEAPRGARIRDAKARIRDAMAVDADSRRATTRGRGRRAIERARRRRRR